MTTDDPQPTAASTPFHGPVEMAAVLRDLLRQAEASAVRRIQWCDPDFSAWPLGAADWTGVLTAWARGGARELWMIAADYRAIERLHPRFVAWRRDWAHVVRCQVPDESRTADLPTLWIDSGDRVMRVFDPEHWRGRAGLDRIDRQRAREDFDALAQRAAPGFASSMLGL